MNGAKALTRTQVREMLLRGGAERILDRLEKVEDMLFYGRETQVDAVTGVEMQLPLDSTRTAQLRTLADMLWRRLDRVVPPLKAIELTGGDGQPLDLSGGHDRLVLATKLLALAREQPDVAELEFLQ